MEFMLGVAQQAAPIVQTVVETKEVIKEVPIEVVPDWVMKAVQWGVPILWGLIASGVHKAVKGANWGHDVNGALWGLYVAAGSFMTAIVDSLIGVPNSGTKEALLIDGALVGAAATTRYNVTRALPEVLARLSTLGKLIWNAVRRKKAAAPIQEF